MTDQERQKIQEQVKRWKRIGREISSDKKKSLKMLVEAGILTPDGEFTEPFRRCSPKK
jgi:hypothetical protein